MIPTPRSPAPPAQRRCGGTLGPWSGLVATAAVLITACVEPNPEPTPEPERWNQQVSVGGSVACILDAEGHVACWGKEGPEWEQVGDDPPQPLPPDPEGEFETIQAGGEILCGLRAGGVLDCWDRGVAARMPSEGPYHDLAASRNMACVVDIEDEVVCWSSGLDTTTGVPFSLGFPPMGLAFTGRVPPELDTQVLPPHGFFCALDEDGLAHCWGVEEDPVRQAPADRFSAISAGLLHVCGLTPGGEVRCWGIDDEGQLDAPAGTYTQVSSGGDYACALAEDCSVTCWGNADGGRLEPPDACFVQIDSGSGANCGITDDDRVLCWGENSGVEHGP